MSDLDNLLNLHGEVFPVDMRTTNEDENNHSWHNANETIQTENHGHR